MTIFFRSHFFFNNFLSKKLFKFRFFKIGPTSGKQHQQNFLKCSKRSGSDNSLLFLFSNGCSSAAIKFNK